MLPNLTNPQRHVPHYFFIDKNGQKQGPINDQQLQMLVAQGIIVPQTPMATDTGYKGFAGQIPGLNFPSSVPSQVSVSVPLPNSRGKSAAYDAGKWVRQNPMIFIIVGCLIGVIFLFGFGVISKNSGNRFIPSDSPQQPLSAVDAITDVVHQSSKIWSEMTGALKAKRYDDYKERCQKLVNIDVTKCPQDVQIAFRKWVNSESESVEIFIGVATYRYPASEAILDRLKKARDTGEEAFKEWESVKRKYGVFD